MIFYFSKIFLLLQFFAHHAVCQIRSPTKISGKVLNGGSSLTLGLYNQNGQLVSEAIVDNDGNYIFSIWPGKYSISPVMDSNNKHCLGQDSIEIEVGTTPLIIKPDLRIEGHTLQVNVVDDEGDPFLYSNVVLQSDKQIKGFENFPLIAKQPITSKKGQKWIYKFDTNSFGSVLIHCLPPGKYLIEGEQKVLNFGEANFEEKYVEMNSRMVEATLSVKSFNLFGYVSTVKQAPLQNVIIKLDGEFNTVSDEKGKFVVANVSPGMHVLAVEKEKFEFNELNFDVSSKTNKLITFLPTRLAICGRVLPDEIEGISFKVSQIYKNGFYLLVTDSHGKFCKMLKPGKYLIKHESSMLLSPDQLQFNLDEPFDLSFAQQPQDKLLETDTNQTSIFEQMMKVKEQMMKMYTSIDEHMLKVVSIISSYGTLLSAWGTLLGVIVCIFGFFLQIHCSQNRIISKQNQIISNQNEVRMDMQRISNDQREIRIDNVFIRAQLNRLDIQR